jgi:hypothetical protein
MDLCFTWRVCYLDSTINICGYGNWATMSQETCEGRGIGSGRIIEGKISCCLSARVLWGIATSRSCVDTLNISKQIFISVAAS